MPRLALHWQIMIAMVIGAVAGIVVNATSGVKRGEAPVEFPAGPLHVSGMSSPVRVEAGTAWFEDTPSQILIEIIEEGATQQDKAKVRRAIVRGPLRDPVEDWPSDDVPMVGSSQRPTKVYPTLTDLNAKDPAAYALFYTYGRSTARWLGDAAQDFGDLFIQMLKMVSIPLVVSSLITAVTGLGDPKRFGRMFSRTLVYYVATSSSAIIVGLLLVNLIRPGVQDRGTPPPDPVMQSAESGEAKIAQPRQGKSLGTVIFEQIESLIPTNPLAAAAEGNFLSIIAFSLLFAIFTILVGGQPAETINQFASSIFEVMMRMTMAIIHLAPLGVLFLMFSATSTQGIAVFQTLGWYMITVAIGLFIHGAIVLPLVLKFIAKRSPLAFARAMSPALLTAFSSASSNGTLPLTLTCAEERAGISNRITAFVLPLGAAVNMDGTALYEMVAVLFIAQMTGIELTLADQVIVAFTGLLASIGTTGIPHAGLIMMLIILQAVGLPTEQQGLIIAVDRVLDMARTTVNVWSDSCGLAVISRFEDLEGEPEGTAS